MLQKISSFLVLVFFIFSLSTQQNFAAYSNNSYLYAKVQLENSAYKKYLKPLEQIVPSLSDEKLYEVQDTLRGKTGGNTDMRILIEFIEVLIEQELQARKSIAAKESMTEIKLSSQEQTKAKKEILEMQAFFAQELQDLIEASISHWDQLTSYEEKGNMNFSVDVNIPSEDISGKVNIDIQDYILKTKNFNQEFTAKVQALFEARESKRNMEGELSTLIDFVLKDGNYYFLLENFSLISEELATENDVQDMIEAIQELAKENTYIKIGDPDTQMALALLKNIQTDTLAAQINKYSKIAMFEAYKKEGSLYYLQPSKALCDTAKEAMNIFDPFSGKECSQKQYEDMLEEFIDSGANLILETGSNNTLRFSLEEGTNELDIDLSWNSQGIHSFIGQFDDTNRRNTMTMGWEYYSGVSLKGYIKAPNEDVDMTLDIELNRDNSIQKALLDMSIVNPFLSFVVYGEYMNDNMNMEMQVSMQGTEFLHCDIGGKIKSDFTDIQGSCDIQYPEFNWQTGDSEIKNIDVVYEFNYDGRDTKNNYSMNIDITFEEDGNISVILENTGTRKQKNHTISAPKKYIDIQDLGSELNTSLYRDIPLSEYDY